jgi:biopolymer transport protein ExbD
MAGAASEDNPVGINVTAMVDIIFCLCIFFMCSFHFKQLQGKIDSWLPKDVGVHSSQSDALLEEIRVVLTFDPTTGTTVTKMGAKRVSNDEELANLISAAYGDYEKAGKSKDDVPVIIDAFPRVPWKDVVNVMNLCKDKGYEKIQFAAPLPEAALAPGQGISGN